MTNVVSRFVERIVLLFMELTEVDVHFVSEFFPSLVVGTVDVLLKGVLVQSLGLKLDLAQTQRRP